MSRQARVWAIAAIAAVALTLLVARPWERADGDMRPRPAQTAGGQLTVSMRSEPLSFNWFTHRDATTHLVTLLTQAKLVRINGATQDLEPWLAQEWSRSDDGLRYTVRLRPDLVFSDGEALTAEDVVFSFAAAADPSSAIVDAITVAGRRLTATAVDTRTVLITFPVPFGPGLRLLDALPIVPRHRLERALHDGAFASAWGLSTPPVDIVGAGPFVLTEHIPGDRLVFRRNARYFRDAASAVPLPYLDGIVVQIIPSQDAQMLAFEAGQNDGSASEMRPEDYAPLKRLAAAGRAQLFDLGAAFDPDGFWINLKPGVFAADPRRDWIQREELRRAISLGVDRQVFVDTVFLGAATAVSGPITPANKRWYAEAVPHSSYDPEAARALLASIGLVDRDGDGVLEDAHGTAARFTLLTSRGQTPLERGAAVIRDELKKLGLVVDVVALESNALVHQFLSGQGYDAVYFHLTTSDTDPASQLDFWMSTGSAHVWNLGPDTSAIEWEREIDDLMRRQVSALDDAERRRLFADVQRLFVEHLPMIHFAVPRVFVAASTRMNNLTPALSRPQLLWAADTISVSH